MSPPHAPPPVPAARADRFRTFYAATYADLLRFAQRRVHPSHAEDVVADVFLVAWRRLDELPTAPGDARAWLFGIARNTILNDRRSGRRRQALTVRLAETTVPPAGTGPEADLDAVAQRVDLAAAWRRLSAVHQETLALRLWDGLSAPEAARVLGISPVAFRLRLTRARRALRAHLDHLPAAGRAPAGLSERSTS
ncbi:RNA polymerase sigma factor [Nocardioides humi]|uniref:RNA polymerase sigma-70 factor, ECF subfamily n=1 Tax=Nocardioides humi TaxID=449461 RepID=A0ABN2A937_9ACTN|nr:sigma-70 family RNA polymerase sigma factor [Nocardioides humi]